MQKGGQYRLKRSAEDILKWFKSISIALNLIEKDTCTNVPSVHIWKKLEIKDVDKSTFKNLQCAMQESIGSLSFFSLPSGSSVL